VSDQLPESEQDQGAVEVLSKEERKWGMACHLCTFGGFIFPCGNILAPLVIRSVKSESMPFVEDQAKESLNFQITVYLVLIVGFLLKTVGIGFLLVWPLVIYVGIAVIIAGFKASKGVSYRYPLAIRFIK